MLLVLLVTLKTLAYPLSLYCSGLVLGTLAPVNDATLPQGLHGPLVIEKVVVVTAEDEKEYCWRE